MGGKPRSKNWSRWRRLKWVRRALNKATIGPGYVTDSIVWNGRFHITGGNDVAPFCMCEGNSAFHGHRADCAYANGN